MNLLMTVLLLLVCLLISNVLSHYIPFIPTALVQIAFGIILVLIGFDFSFEIKTEWFLLLFVAPILFNDGRNFPREELWRMKTPILGNAILLVVLTTLGGGYFIHWMIIDIPLAAAFALAAILSPTDPVAVNGIARRFHIPQKALNLVRGESLINDASGLVAFNYAVLAVVTGYFSLQEAVLDFGYKFFAGGILGIVIGLAITWIRFSLRKQGIQDVTFHSLLQLLTPFLVYMVTEELLHASGVIAVVAAGIVHSLVRERTETLMAEEQVLTENIWTIVLFVLNGIVFLLLGLNIPASMEGTLENPNHNYWIIIGYVIAIGAVILGIRFIWAYLFSHYEYRFAKEASIEKPTLLMALFVSLTGVRGTVTMAGVLSIPYLMDSGEPFPNRSLILFLAAGVILMTLILATIMLPLLSRGRETEEGSAGVLDLTEARKRVLLASIQKIRSEMNEKNAVAADELIQEYETMLQQLEPGMDAVEQATDRYQRQMREVRLKALEIERKFIQELIKEEKVDDAVYKAFERSFNHREEQLSKNARFKQLFFQGKLLKAWKFLRRGFRESKETKLANLQLEMDVQLKALQATLENLEEYKKEDEGVEVIEAVISDYRRMINRLEKPAVPHAEKYQQQKEELRIKVMDSGRLEIHRMYGEGEITRDQVRALRRFVNHVESVILQEPVG